MLAWALCSGFKNGYINLVSVTGANLSEVNYSVGGIGFFLFVTVTLWIIVIVFIILGVLSLLERLKIPMKLLIVSIIRVQAYFVIVL